MKYIFIKIFHVNFYLHVKSIYKEELLKTYLQFISIKKRDYFQAQFQ